MASRSHTEGSGFKIFSCVALSSESSAALSFLPINSTVPCAAKAIDLMVFNWSGVNCAGLKAPESINWMAWPESFTISSWRCARSRSVSLVRSASTLETMISANTESGSSVSTLRPISRVFSALLAAW